ncbi:hypothetical protein FQN54_008580 [Arachnomyces sp. PD_36]|nr:hypothetical protein FQN54_008580 [Arachnomyces sp. PD_36]
MALRSYDRKIRRKSRWSHTANEQRANQQWIQRYETEENRCVEMLQRRRRLEEERLAAIATLSSMSGDSKALPPNYESTPSQHSHQLEEIMEQYRLHRKELEKLEARKPIRSPIVKKWEMLRRCKTFKGLTLAWVRDSQTCAVRGGCCGRPCGCCDKPLMEFLMPTGGFRGKKKSAIYGHCTAECSCCNRSLGFDLPNAAKNAEPTKPAPANGGNRYGVAPTNNTTAVHLQER